MDTLSFKWPVEEFLRSIDIHEVLPQQEPFVMIGRLVQLDEVQTITETVICVDNIFVEDGCFSASGMIENIAEFLICNGISTAPWSKLFNRDILLSYNISFPEYLSYGEDSIFLYNYL